MDKKPDNLKIFKRYDEGVNFKNSINLQQTVEENENFFIGKQWEGVQSNGLPTPQYNYIKRTVLFNVASNFSDNIKIQATPLAVSAEQRLIEQMGEIVTNEYEALFEYNNMLMQLQEYMRNAAVDGDACLYTYWDADVETGRPVKGAIKTEVIENTRVYFGNVNERRVQRQPYIIIESRDMLKAVKREAKKYGCTNIDSIKTDNDSKDMPSQLNTDRVTKLLYMWRDEETGHIWASVEARGVTIRKAWDMGIKLYPITWLSWDYIQDCYHGSALVTGMIPNQIFVNKCMAMMQISIMQSAFPKVVYDKTRVSKWSNQVGTAIGINGGDVNNVARILEPAQISPQISEFLKFSIDTSQSLLGANAAALGDVRPDNTSAIIALQRASAVPSTLTKNNFYQSIDDLGQIWLEFMREYYGKRIVRTPTPDLTGLPIAIDNNTSESMPFDFGTLRDYPMSLKIDVGASAYWSEIASQQTMDNMLMLGSPDFTMEDYLERVPNIPKKQELLDKMRQRQSIAPPQTANPQVPEGGITPEGQPPIPTTAGNSALQRAVAQTA